MHRWLSVLAMLGCGLGTLATVNTAHACSCGFWYETFPEPDTRGLPLNVRVWQVLEPSYLEEGLYPVRLYELATEEIIETEVQVVTSADEGPVLVSYRPSRELSPGGFYDARHYDGGNDEEFTVLTTFSVGDARDDEPPPPPSVTNVSVRSERSEGSCGTYDSFGAAVEVTYEAFVVLDRDGESSLTDEPEGYVSTLSASANNPHYVGVGNGSCVDNWPDVGEGSTALLRVGQFDLAGNFSGWDEGTMVEVPELPPLEEDTAADEGCGCRQTPSLPMGPLGLLAGLVLVARRRR